MAETFYCTALKCPLCAGGVRKCTAPHCENRTPPTNADRIRAMSDEELARWIWAVQSGVYHEKIVSTDGWRDWLYSPVEGDP